MRALVYHGPGNKAWEEVPDPTILEDTDAIVRVDAVTICGTDLHILKGDVPAVTDGRILGHEAVGTIEEVGAGVKTRPPGDRVLVSCITACGRCRFCREGTLRPVPRRRRLDPRAPDRRHPGRVRPGAVRRHVHLPRARRRCPTRSVLMLADIVPTALRGRRAERRGPARRHRRRRRRRSDRARRDAHGAARSRPSHIVAIDVADAGSRPPSISGPTSSSTTALEDAGRSRRGPHRRPRRRRGDRGGRRTGDVRALHAGSFAPAGTSPTSASTASPPRCTSKTCGSRTSRSRLDWWTRTPRRRCCSLIAIRPARHRPVRDAPVRPGRVHGCVRRLLEGRARPAR